MRALVISDFGIHHTPGGAQRSNDIIIKKGLELGHEIDVVHYDSDFSILNRTGDYDYVISSNMEQLCRVNGLIDLLYSLNNHVRLEHDMNMYLQDEDRYKLFSNCYKTFFLTEYHHNRYLDFYGDYFQNVEIVADPIDTKLFYGFGGEREDVILSTGFMHSLKGTNVFINYTKQNPDKDFVYAGWGSEFFMDQIRSLKNVEFLGSVAYSDMPALYNRVSSIFYKPNIHEPFCRSVGEAILCGVPNLVVNDIIGCVHEESRLGFDEFKNSCNNAATKFWKAIDENINH
jgi:glycosyltransferase involved in cell wall biosynthesis